MNSLTYKIIERLTTASGKENFINECLAKIVAEESDANRPSIEKNLAYPVWSGLVVLDILDVTGYTYFGKSREEIATRKNRALEKLSKFLDNLSLVEIIVFSYEVKIYTAEAIMGNLSWQKENWYIQFRKNMSNS